MIVINFASLTKRIVAGGFQKQLSPAEVKRANNQNLVKTFISGLKADDFAALSNKGAASAITKQNVLEALRGVSSYSILSKAQKALLTTANVLLQVGNGKLTVTMRAFGLEKVITVGNFKGDLQISYFEKIKSLVTMLQQVVKTKHPGRDYKNDPNVQAALPVFKEHNITISLERGTSRRYPNIGNNYGNVTTFLNNLVGKTFKQLNVTTIPQLAALFVPDPNNDKYENVATITMLLEKAWSGDQPAAPRGGESLKSVGARIKSLISDLQEVVKTKYLENNYPNDPNAQATLAIFKKHGITIEPKLGTSRKYPNIGNKYGNVTTFLNNLVGKTFKQLNVTTIPQLAALFVPDPNNDKYKNVATITSYLKKIWVSYQRAKSATARDLVTDSYYKHPGSLIDNDDFWQVDKATYSDGVTRGLGQTYYKDLAKDSAGKWNVQFNLEDWVNVYDTRFEEMTRDLDHIYAPSKNRKGAPKKYDPNLAAFYNIYNDQKVGRQRTGNNNNGANGLYSGAQFEAKIVNDKKQKRFNVKTILGINKEEVVLGLTKRGKKLLHNGWEHVLPRSQVKKVLNQETVPYALSDLHNIRPSFQQLFNNPRANYHFGIVPGDNHKYFGIDFEIGQSSFGLKVVEPRVSVRGDIARILFYMHNRYHIKYDLNYYKLLLLWARMDPVTPEEIALDDKIKAVMGFSNPYVTGQKKLPYDQQVEAIILRANGLPNPKLAVSVQPKRILWSKTPGVKAAARGADQ